VVVHGALVVVHGALVVVHGALVVVHGALVVVHGALVQGCMCARWCCSWLRGMQGRTWSGPVTACSSAGDSMRAPRCTHWCMQPALTEA
jgi:hypothetical protein